MADPIRHLPPAPAPDAVELARRHALEIAAQVAQRHAGCIATSTHDVQTPRGIVVKTCGELIAEELRWMRGSNKTRLEVQTERLDAIASKLALVLDRAHGASFCANFDLVQLMLQEAVPLCAQALLQRAVVDTLKERP